MAGRQNGLDIGFFGKVGVYGNRIKQNSRYLASLLIQLSRQTMDDERASFVLRGGCDGELAS